MYLRIRIAPPDRGYFRLLWRNLETKSNPDVYEFERIVFGKNSAPFEVQYTIQERTRRNQDLLPAAAETVLESTYMDDSMDSTPHENTAIELYHQLSELWAKAGMHARKWLSNSTKVLREIPQEDRPTEIDIDRDDLPSTNALGVAWIAQNTHLRSEPYRPVLTFNLQREMS